MAREVRLLEDGMATAVPSGREVLLRKGSLLAVTQMLGGSVTVRDGAGIYRVEGEALDALGPEIADEARAGAPEVEGSEEFSEQQVWDALRSCYDPEIPLNIVDLGLVYDLTHRKLESGRHHVDVRMTLTAMGCGMGPAIAADARHKVESLPSVESAKVEIVWDPQWTPHMISAEGRQVLGLE